LAAEKQLPTPVEQLPIHRLVPEYRQISIVTLEI